MNSLLPVMLPEIILSAFACALFLLGVSSRPASRRFAPVLALIGLLIVFLLELTRRATGTSVSDTWNTFRINELGHYVKLLSAGVGMLFVLMSWPTARDATGNSSMNVGEEVGEYFGLMLLAITGIMLVAGANDIILLFLGIELASIPTYIMVSISRPLPVAQEAGVKYFFLGAMSAAIMLFGFCYVYGTTGELRLDVIAREFAAHPERRSWQIFAVVMLIAGLCFKLAAVPLHFYAGDVYQGAATPVTALLSFVPKATGVIALVKTLAIIGGSRWIVPETIFKLLWVLAVLTMSVGNILALVQLNVKRVLAYSSIAHSGYLLVGIATLAGAHLRVGPELAEVQQRALQGVLFYLAAYGIMNAGAFGVLMLLPSRERTPSTTAETYEDLAGQGRRHVGLGLAMSVSCFSLIGLPLTVGFFGKYFLLQPALQANMVGLVIATVINAAISAAYYLRIVGAMFLRPDPETIAGAPVTTGYAPGETSATDDRDDSSRAWPIMAAVALSVIGTLALGTLWPLTNRLNNRARTAAAGGAQTVADLETQSVTQDSTTPAAPVLSEAAVQTLGK